MSMRASVTVSLSRHEPGGPTASARLVLNQQTHSSANYADAPFQSRKESGHAAPNHRIHLPHPPSLPSPASRLFRLTPLRIEGAPGLVALVFIMPVSIAVASIVVLPCAAELRWASELPRLVLLPTALTEPTEVTAAAATNLTRLATSRSWRSS